MKPETTIKVISSSGEPYNVHFEFIENKFKVHCNCPAGIYGKLCKHKTGLLDGDYSLLFDKADNEVLEQIHNIVKKSKYVELLISYNTISKEIEIARKKEKKQKEQIEHLLKTGIDII
jgi:hypothetical protein